MNPEYEMNKMHLLMCVELGAKRHEKQANNPSRANYARSLRILADRLDALPPDDFRLIKLHSLWCGPRYASAGMETPEGVPVDDVIGFNINLAQKRVIDSYCRQDGDPVAFLDECIQAIETRLDSDRVLRAV